jgi:hypothetical protein
MKKPLALVCGLMLVLAGCAPLIKKTDLTKFNAHKPRSIVVVPVQNDSPEVTAPTVFISTITVPLAERGYYVFPVFLAEMLLRDLGLPEAGHIHQLPPDRYFELFGADAVLLVTIKDWSTKYLVINSSVVVDVEYLLKDTRTGTVLWESQQHIVHSSGGGSDPIAMLVSAALNALFTDYLPLARRANTMVFSPPTGIPAGPYHPEYGRDHDRF